MNNLLRWGFALAVLPVAACTGNDVNPMAATVPQPMPAAPTVNAVDNTFAMQAASSNQFEIQSSQLALQHTRNARVRRFAQQMIDDHTTMEQNLAQIASAKGMTRDATMEPQQDKMMAGLNGLRGPRFDHLYLHDQVVAHRMTATLFQNEIANGMDPDIKAAAQTGLPMIQAHERMARRLGGR